jgi:hypothetical protein
VQCGNEDNKTQYGRESDFVGIQILKSSVMNNSEANPEPDNDQS